MKPSMKRLRHSLMPLIALACATTYATPALQQTMPQHDAREHARAAAIAASKAFGAQEQVVIEEPARSYIDWGAILQPNGTVVTVRANSVAAAMGLQKNDQLTHINGNAINERELASTLEMIAGLEHGETFTVTVKRQADVVELSGVAQATVIPGWRLEVNNSIAETTVNNAESSACGRVSVFFTPPETRDFYPAFINSIDGDNVRVRNPNFKLNVGEHVIGVHELIADRSVRRSSGIDPEKQLKITIEANKTYYIAAHFIREKRLSRQNAEYWEPVVWKVTDSNCTLE